MHAYIHSSMYILIFTQHFAILPHWVCNTFTSFLSHLFPDVPQLPPLVIENNKDDEEEEDDEEVVGRDRVQDQEQTDEDGFSQHQHHHQQQHQQSSSGSKRRPRRTESSHRQASADPYSDDLGSIFTTAGLMVPIAVAAIAVVPLLFCLCRL